MDVAPRAAYVVAGDDVNGGGGLGEALLPLRDRADLNVHQFFKRRLREVLLKCGWRLVLGRTAGRGWRVREVSRRYE